MICIDKKIIVCNNNIADYERIIMITNIIKYTAPFEDGKYALEVEYDDKESELLEFDTQIEQIKRYEELCK